MQYSKENTKDFFRYVKGFNHDQGNSDSLIIAFNCEGTYNNFNFTVEEFMMVMNGWLPDKLRDMPIENYKFFNRIMEVFQIPLNKVPLFLNDFPIIAGWRLRRGT